MIPSASELTFWLTSSSFQLLIGGSIVLLAIRCGLLRGNLACVAIALTIGFTLFPEHLLPAAKRAPLPETTGEVASRPVAEGGDSATSLQSVIHLSSLPFRRMILGAWGIGTVGIGLFAFISAWRSSRRFVREQACLDPRLLNALEEVKQRLGLFVPVSVYESDHLSSPALHGALRPRLLLPRGLHEELSDSALDQLLAHECVHIRRNDVALHWLLLLSVLPLWFHPMIWLLVPAFLRQREIACDRQAIARLSLAPDSYADALLSFARRATTSPLKTTPLSLAGIAEPQSLIEQRIQDIMKPTKNHLPGILATLIATAALIVTVPALRAIELEPDSGVTQAELDELEERGEEILDAIWDLKKPEAGYATASTYYKEEVSLKDYKAKVTPVIKSIEIKSQKLVSVTELKGAEAIPGGKNVHLVYLTKIKGTNLAATENLFLIKEGEEWLMTGHWLK